MKYLNFWRLLALTECSSSAKVRSPRNICCFGLETVMHSRGRYYDKRAWWNKKMLCVDVALVCMKALTQAGLSPLRACRHLTAVDFRHYGPLGSGVGNWRSRVGQSHVCPAAPPVRWHWRAGWSSSPHCASQTYWLINLYGRGDDFIDPTSLYVTPRCCGNNLYTTHTYENNWQILISEKD